MKWILMLVAAAAALILAREAPSLVRYVKMERM
jgi:hypothetical protein